MLRINPCGSHACARPTPGELSPAQPRMAGAAPRTPLSIDPVLSRVAPYTCYVEQVRLLPKTIRHKRTPPRGTKERQAPKPELQNRLYGTDPLIF